MYLIEHRKQPRLLPRLIVSVDRVIDDLAPAQALQWRRIQQGGIDAVFLCVIPPPHIAQLLQQLLRRFQETGALQHGGVAGEGPQRHRALRQLRCGGGAVGDEVAFADLASAEDGRIVSLQI